MGMHIRNPCPSTSRPSTSRVLKRCSVVRMQMLRRKMVLRLSRQTAHLELFSSRLATHSGRENRYLRELHLLHLAQLDLLWWPEICHSSNKHHVRRSNSKVPRAPRNAPSDQWRTNSGSSARIRWAHLALGTRTSDTCLCCQSTGPLYISSQPHRC